MRLHSVVITVALALSWGGVTASARPADPKALAKRHFEKGELFYQQGEFRKALAEYKIAQQHFRHPAFIFNIAQCHRQLKEWERAKFFYELYLSESPAAPNKAEVAMRIKEAKAKAEEAKRAAATLGRVSVITRPEGASVRVDRFTGPALAQSPAMVPIPAGQHLVLIEKEGYEKVHRTVNVASGQIAMVEVTLVPKAGGQVTPPREEPRRVEPREEPRRAEPREEPRRVEPPLGGGGGPPLRKPFYKTWWFWTGTGAAVVFAGLGAVAGVKALGSHQRFVDEGNPRDLEDARTRARAADILFGLTGAAALTTIIVTAIYAKRRRADRRRALVVPSCGPGGCGLAVSGWF